MPSLAKPGPCPFQLSEFLLIQALQCSISIHFHYMIDLINHVVPAIGAVQTSVQDEL